MSEGLDPRMERVIRYVEGDLPADERTAFEAELAADPLLREDLDVARRTLDGLKSLGEEHLRRELKAADDELAPKKGGRSWWWAAAAIVVLGGLSWWISSDSVTSPQALAEEFAMAEPGLPVLMSAEPGRMDAIMNAYKRGELDLAEQLIDAGLRTDPGNDTLNYFRGVVEEQRTGCAEARTYFDRLPDGSAFKGKAGFRLAICDLRVGKVTEARMHLERVTASSDVQLAGRARDLLDRLSDR